MPEPITTVQPGTPAAAPAPETAKPQEKVGMFEGDKMAAWAEEMHLFDKEPSKPAPAPPSPPASPAPFKVLKVQGKEVPVKSEEELIALAQQGVDYTQKRQRDAARERELDEREELLKKLEGPINTLAERVRAGKPIDGAEEEGTPFGTEDTEVSDPVAQAKIKALEKKIEDMRLPVDQIAAERQAREVEEVGIKLTNFYDEAKKEHPFEDVAREGDEVSTTNMMFAGYISALHNKEKIRSKQEKGYVMKPIQELIRKAADDFSFVQAKLRGSSATPSPELTLEAIRETRPDLYQKIQEEAVRAFTSNRSSNPAIVKPSEGEARTSRTAPNRQGRTLDESLSDAMNDPEVAGIFDELAKGGRDIRQYGLR